MSERLDPRAVALYLRAYATEQGHWLFEQEMRTYGLLGRIESEERRILHNLGVQKLENMGILPGRNYGRITDFLLTLAPDQANVMQPEEQGNGRR